VNGKQVILENMDLIRLLMNGFRLYPSKSSGFPNQRSQSDTSAEGWPTVFTSFFLLFSACSTYIHTPHPHIYIYIYIYIWLYM